MPLLRAILCRTFYTTATLSTLLLLATLILWPLSYYRNMDASYGAPFIRAVRLGGYKGRAVIYYLPLTPPNAGLEFRAEKIYPDPAGLWTYTTWHRPDFDHPTSLYAGVSYFALRGSRVLLGQLFIPFTYLALLFSILPLLAFRSLRRRRQAARTGLCPNCSYDLRAHAPGSLCPECGTPVTSLK